MDVSGPVLLFDEECGLCVRCVRLLLVTDRRVCLRFAPLQGREGQIFLRERGLPTEDFDSAIFVRDGSPPSAPATLYRTDALFAAMATVGGAWHLLTWLRVLPRGLRDLGYGWVARWRRRFFGKGNAADLYATFDSQRFLR